MKRNSLFNLAALSVFVLGILAFTLYEAKSPTPVSSENQLSQLGVSLSTSTILSSVATSSKSVTVTPLETEKAPNKAAFPVSTSTGDEVARVQNPYESAPESFTEINNNTRAALVNILCQPEGGSLLPISGSGVIIDPRGVILTNAHVAQYVLLSESPRVDLSCAIRTGSPAKSVWGAVVLYIPPVWVDQHASEILDQHPEGTGEHDYALLYIIGATGSDPLPSQFPYLPTDTRSAIAFPDDQVLVASYPAEFIGGIAAQYELYAASSVTTIKQLLTFSSGTPDLLSLGGIIEAQSGSSGGAVVNAWGHLVGVVVTTSSGSTTADRDLRAVALSYINSDLTTQSGQSLDSLLQGNPAAEAASFSSLVAPSLVNQYIGELSSN